MVIFEQNSLFVREEEILETYVRDPSSPSLSVFFFWGPPGILVHRRTIVEDPVHQNPTL